VLVETRRTIVNSRIIGRSWSLGCGLPRIGPRGHIANDIDIRLGNVRSRWRNRLISFGWER